MNEQVSFINAIVSDAHIHFFQFIQIFDVSLLIVAKHSADHAALAYAFQYLFIAHIEQPKICAILYFLPFDPFIQ